MTRSSKIDLFESVDRFVVAAASDEPMEEELDADFERMLQESEDACDMYIECVQMSLLLPSILAGETEAEGDSDDAVFSGQNHGSSPYPLLGFLTTTLHGTVGCFSSGWPVAYLIATVVFGIGLVVGSRMPTSRPQPIAKESSAPSRSAVEPKIESVGRITGLVDCRWADPSRAPVGYDAVPLGRKYALSSGLMEIAYDTGAKVILQGPVKYEVESRNGGFLAIGKLTGKAEVEMARGFVVRTPTATVIDLGTEFGVEVNNNGYTTSHVFRGSVRLQVVSADRTAEAITRVLRENESACVESSGNQGGGNRITMLGSTAKPAGFVREVPKHTVTTLDLVDVVAGGDGFSGRRGRGIDPTNGRPTDTTLKDYNGVGFPIIVGDEKYHRVETLPLVDGVFIPNGRSGAVQVDSAGHNFANFDKTDNTTAGNIWAGGMIPVPSSAMPSSVSSLLASLPPSQTLLPTKLGGIDYATPGRGLIFLHANNGITFDLEAIRRASPGFKLLRFRATAGNVEPISETGAAAGLADLWVLVDGQVRFRRREINGLSGAFPILFPVAENDHFLTLAATDGGKATGMAGDWILFGNPVLEMVTSKQKGE